MKAYIWNAKCIHCQRNKEHTEDQHHESVRRRLSPNRWDRSRGVVTRWENISEIFEQILKAEDK